MLYYMQCSGYSDYIYKAPPHYQNMNNLVSQNGRQKNLESV